MRVECSVAVLRTGQLANAALKERDVAEGVGIHAKLHPRISPPLGLLAPGAIDVGVKHAIAQRLAAHAPDVVEQLIAAFKSANILHRRVDLPQADVLDLQRSGEIAKNKRGVAESFVMERL